MHMATSHNSKSPRPRGRGPTAYCLLHRVHGSPQCWNGTLLRHLTHAPCKVSPVKYALQAMMVGLLCGLPSTSAAPVSVAGCICPTSSYLLECNLSHSFYCLTLGEDFQFLHCLNEEISTLNQSPCVISHPGLHQELISKINTVPTHTLTTPT